VITQSQKEAATIAVLLQSMRQSRLPRAQRMLEKVNTGATLSEGDISFLERVLRDIRINQSLIYDNAGLLKFIRDFIDLHSAIVAKALENEKRGSAAVSGTQAGAG
jgi:hypothetical protein